MTLGSEAWKVKRSLGFKHLKLPHSANVSDTSVTACAGQRSCRAWTVPALVVVVAR